MYFMKIICILCKFPVAYICQNCENLLTCVKVVSEDKIGPFFGYTVDIYMYNGRVLFHNPGNLPELGGLNSGFSAKKNDEPGGSGRHARN